MTAPSCAGCKWSRAMTVPGNAQQTVCVNEPPKPLVVMGQHPMTHQLTTQVVSLFPAVNKDMYCSRWTEAIPQIVQ